MFYAVRAGYRYIKGPEYITEIVKRGDIKEVVSETGIVKAVKEVKLSFKYGGTVKTVKVKAGDRVKKDQALILLKTDELKIQEKKLKPF